MGAIDKESFQHAKEAVEISKANLNSSRNQLAANQALLSKRSTTSTTANTECNEFAQTGVVKFTTYKN